MAGIQLLSQQYHRFAEREASGKSSLYEHLARQIAKDEAVLSLLTDLPQPKQQPNLLLGSYRHLFGIAQDYDDFRATLLAHFPAVRAFMLTHATQTNEPARCAPLLPVLAALRQPLALIEVGASAGLCLLPDLYGYDFPSTQLRPAVAESTYPIFSCRADAGTPLPVVLPQIVWRGGLDLNPLDIGNPDQAAWLKTLVWPEQEERAKRLAQAIDLAARNPPHLLRADLIGPALEQLCKAAPKSATLVIFHTAVLSYIADEEARRSFARRAMAAADIWICNEHPQVMPHIARTAPPPPRAGAFLLSVNERPVAWTDPHGAWIEAIETGFENLPR